MNNEMPQYLHSLIPEKVGTKRPQSRNPDNFYSMRTRIETYRSSFIPSSVRLYNSLDIIDRSFGYVNSLMKRPSRSLFYHGSRSSGIKHAQLRMKCSKLNFHLFSLHVVDSPACPSGHDCEDSNHYLLRCPLFYQARNMLLNEIRELTMTDVSCELLLYESADLSIEISKEVFDAVHSIGLLTILADCNL